MPQTDKYGIEIFPNVARVDQYGEVAVKRFLPSCVLNRSNHLLVVNEYGLQGLAIIEEVKKEIETAISEKKQIDTFLLSRLCHKAANAFLESDKAGALYSKKYGNYGRGTEG